METKVTDWMSEVQMPYMTLQRRTGAAMLERTPRQGRLEGCHDVCRNAPDLWVGQRVVYE